MTASEPTGWSPAHGQARVVLAFLALALGLIAGVDALARDRGLERWMTARSSDLSARNGKLFSNNGNFIDYEERMLLDELPTVDFRQPALYFFGTSNMKWAFTTWDLPEAQRRRLHNFGTGAASHQTVLRLIRYLGDKGMWAAGARNEVVLGVSYHLGVTETPNSFFPALVRRDDLYAITSDDRLIDTPRASLDRWLRTEKARSAGFLWGLWRLAGNRAVATLRPSRQPPHDAVTYRQGWQAYMGPDWQANIDRELGRLAQTIAELRGHGVPVKVILLPQGSWMKELPFASYYDARVRALCAGTATPLLDWSGAMADADFIDSNHLTNAGQTKFRDMLFAAEPDRLGGGTRPSTANETARAR